MISSAPQTARPTAMIPGKSAGPIFWPGIVGKLCTCTKSATDNRMNSAPQTASLSFTLR